MFRGNRHSAAWLACAAGLLLHLGTVRATTAPPIAPTMTTSPVLAASAPDVLRVLAVPPDGARHGPDKGGQAYRMLDDFARAIGRRMVWTRAPSPDEVLTELAAGRADVVVGASGPPPDRSQSAGNLDAVAATSPVATERFVVVGRKDNAARNPLELTGMSVAMRRACPHWTYFEHAQRVVPNLKLQALSNELTRTAPLQLVADGMVDVAVIPVIGDLNVLTDHPRLKPLFDLSAERPLSWYVRRDDPALLANLNQFIDRYHAAYFEPSATLRDFAAIKRRGVLRVITRVEPGNYFIEDGRPSGFELELAANFAERHHLRLEVRVAEDETQIFDWLDKGKGDLVTARVVGDAPQTHPGVLRSRAYRYDAYVTVSRRGLPLHSPADLPGLVFAAPEHSPEYRALLSMRARLPGISVIAVSPEVSESLLLQRVADGMVDATVLPASEALQLAMAHPELAIGTSIAHDYDYRWTVRDGNEALRAAIDDFLVDAQRSGLTSMLAARYEARRETRTLLAARDDRLSPYDPIVQHYADLYGFDWRLIAAQMYQESQFDPRAVSPSGARGLMQLMPSTAQSLGIGDLARPESSIHAGVKYLFELRNEFDAEVPVGERTWFALAAYNVGAQRVERARRYAARLRLDPNRWAGNVEVAMLKLARPGGGGLDRRSGQAIIYVRTIQSLYGSYRHLQVSAAPGLTSVPRA